MKQDPGSNYNIAEVYAAASVGASTVYTSEVDHAKAQSGSFAITCGTFATSFAVTLQHSPDKSTWTDEVAGAGNDLSGALTAAGDLVIDVPNPRARYTRLKIVLGGTCVFGVIAISGPLLNVVPSATTV
jgi:hypothetical protein